MSGHNYDDPRRDRILGRHRRGGGSSPQLLPNAAPPPEWLSLEQIASERQLCCLLLRRLKESQIIDPEFNEILRDYLEGSKTGRILGPIDLDYDLLWIPFGEERQKRDFVLLRNSFLYRHGMSISDQESATRVYTEAASSGRKNVLMDKIKSHILAKQLQLQDYFRLHNLNFTKFYDLFAMHHRVTSWSCSAQLEWLSQERLFNTNNISRVELDISADNYSPWSLMRIANWNSTSDKGDTYCLAGGSGSHFHFSAALVFSDFQLDDHTIIPNALLKAIRIFQMVSCKPSAGGGQRSYSPEGIGMAWGIIPLVEFRFHVPPQPVAPHPSGSPRSPAPQPSSPAPQPSPDDSQMPQ